MTSLVKQVLTNPLHVLSFGLGAGFLPTMPGTWGSVVAIPCVWLLQQLPLNPWVVLLMFTVFACWCCDYTAKSLGIGDHPGIVLDEIVGFYWAVFLLPTTPLAWLLAFGLFRLFDIWKPWPIHWLEQRLPGGVGIVVDDCMAGVYAGLILTVLFIVWC